MLNASESEEIVIWKILMNRPSLKTNNLADLQYAVVDCDLKTTCCGAYMHDLRQKTLETCVIAKRTTNCLVS